MLSILNKLGSEYSVFVSTFHYGRASIPNWNMPTLDVFTDSLIHEQEKLVQLGVLQTSKNQALLMTDYTNVQDKGENMRKEPTAFDSKPKESQKSSEGASSSKKKKKFEKTKYPYCMRGFHPESQRMKKQIDQKSSLLE